MPVEQHDSSLQSSGTSGLRRAFSWLRGKRRKKKAAGAEGAEPAAPRAKKADDKARKAKGKGRGKAAGHLGRRGAVPGVRPEWLRLGSAACPEGADFLGVGAGGAKSRDSVRAPRLCATPLLMSQTQPSPALGVGGPPTGAGIPRLSLEVLAARLLGR